MVQADDVKNELDRLSTPQPLEIVLVNTELVSDMVMTTMSPAVADGQRSDTFLLEQGVRLTGTDGWSWMLHLFTPKNVTRERH